MILPRLHWFFLVISIPALVAFALLTPPFQQPDEAAHLFKAAHLSLGHAMGIKIEDHVDSGGYIDKSYRALYEQLGKAAVPLRDIAQVRAIAISGELSFAGFPNTVQYGPFLYAPQAATLWLSRQLRLSVLQSFYAARIITGLVAILIGFIALRIVMRGQLVLFCLLTMPMSLFLLGSISQDSLLISSSALFSALTTRIIASERPPTVVQALLLTGLLIAISLGRPTYILLGGVFLTQPLAFVKCGPNRLLRHAGILLLVASICIVAMWMVAISNTRVNLLPGVDAGQQLEFLLAHPLHMPSLLWHTVWRYGPVVAAGFFGLLGLHNIVLPMVCYFMAAAGLTLSALHGATQPFALSLKDRCIVSASIVGGVLVTLLALYLTWTPIGAAIVEGLQGRYFIPLAMLLPLCLPVVSSNCRLARMTGEWAARIVALTAAAGATAATITIGASF